MVTRAQQIRRGGHEHHRRIELIRAGWGAALLIAPRRLVGRVLDAPVDRRAVVVGRILGARHLLQALLSGVHPSSDVLAMGVWVDAAHSAAGVGLASADPARARPAIVDAAVAAAWAGAGYHDLASTRPVSTTRQRRRDSLARTVLRIVPGGRTLLARADNPGKDTP